MALAVGGVLLQAQKLQHHGVFDDVLGLRGQLCLVAYGEYSGHVVTQQQALKELAVHLMLQRPGRPIIVGCFSQAKRPLIGVVEADERFVVHSTQQLPQCGRNYRSTIHSGDRRMDQSTGSI